MPNIQISDEQAAALARGEDITVQPPSTPLHNVVVYQTCGRSFYVYDGERLPNDVVVATRWQKLTAADGKPWGNTRVSTRERKVAFPSATMSLRAIIQVGA